MSAAAPTVITVRLSGSSWEEMRDVLLEAVAQQMGLADAKFEMEPLKLLIYEPGGRAARLAAVLAGESPVGVILSLTP